MSGSEYCTPHNLKHLDPRLGVQSIPVEGPPLLWAPQDQAHVLSTHYTGHSVPHHPSCHNTTCLNNCHSTLQRRARLNNTFLTGPPPVTAFHKYLKAQEELSPSPRLPGLKQNHQQPHQTRNTSLNHPPCRRPSALAGRKQRGFLPKKLQFGDIHLIFLVLWMRTYSQLSLLPCCGLCPLH